MRFIDDPQSVLLCWRDAVGWEALYAPKKPGGAIRAKPIIGWALLAKPGTGREPALAVHGVHSFICNELTLAGREKNFLGYARADEDIRPRFGKNARKTAWSPEA